MADVHANGVRLHVQRLGSGPPAVLFVHGLVMDNLSSFYFTLANPVAQAAEALLFDLRGHGKSERPPSGYAVADFVADLAGLVAALAPAGALHLVGNSFGGLLALAFAASHPGRAASLTLIDAHVGLPGWAEQMTATLELQGEARDRRIAEDFRHWLGRNSERKSSRLAETARALVEQTSLVEDLRRSPPLSSAALRALDLPVLALYGERSDRRADAEALRELVPQTRLVLRPGSTHSVLWEATPWVRGELLAWLAERR
ncbi:MAG TPA: alpha/beta hydrolase [Myxococcales bacterium]|nr:alpha/beta hydrolase [Myxococcales bacterium]